jgi:hypothetical protein
MKKADQYLKWVEWNDEDQTYLGKCPDVITGIHGDNPLQLYIDLCNLVEEVLDIMQSQGRMMPPVRTRPMQKLV